MSPANRRISLQESPRPTQHEPSSLQSGTQTAESACSHCEGLNSHENWCVTQNENVYYAHLAVLQPKNLTLGDQLILHALGVAWKTPETRSRRRTSR